MLLDHYTPERFPHAIGRSGPWIIRHNGEGYCAAIPEDMNAGHLPCGYGTLAQASAILRSNGELFPA